MVNIKEALVVMATRVVVQACTVAAYTLAVYLQVEEVLSLALHESMPFLQLDRLWVYRLIDR